MKFIANKSEFQQAILEAQRVTSGRMGIATLQGILLECRNNHIVLTGGDKNLCLETTINADVLEEGQVVIDSRLLGDIIRKLPHSLVEISTVNKNNIRIVCEKNIITLACHDNDSFPKLPSLKEDLRISISQSILKNMIRATIIATEQNSLRPIFTGTLFDLKKDMLVMVSLDNSRAAICRHANDSADTVSVVIPGRTLGEVAKIIDLEGKDVDISFTTNHILFTIGNTKVISTLLEGDFGKYEAFIPNEYSLEIIVNKESLIGHLERATVIGREGNYSAVILDINDNVMTIISNSQFGNITGEMDIISHGMPMVIKFNSRYLLEALNTMEEDEVILKFTSSKSVLVVTNRSNADTLHIIAPVRM